MCIALVFFFSPFFSPSTASVTRSHSSPSPSPHHTPQPPSCRAVCHGREVRHHAKLQWCVECIRFWVPRRWMTTNQTSVTGFQQHEKYIDPSARLEMGRLHSLEFHCCPQTTSLDVTRSLLLLLRLREQTVRAPLIIATSSPFLPPSLLPTLAHLAGLVSLPSVC